MYYYAYDTHTSFPGYKEIPLSIRTYRKSYETGHTVVSDRPIPEARNAFIPHNHDTFEFLRIHTGQLHVVINGQLFTLTAGDCAAFNPYDLHSGWLYRDEYVIYDCLMTDIQLFKPSLGGSLAAKMFADIFSGARMLKRIYRSSTSGVRELADAFDRLKVSHDKYLNTPDASGECRLLSDFFGFMAAVSDFEAENDRLFPQNRDIKFIREVTAQVDKTYASDPTAEEVAAALGYGQRNFYRLFKQNFGVTFSNYLREYQITKAAELFKGSEKTVAEIAAAVGFSDYCYFSRIFRRHIGVSPAKFFNGQQRSQSKSEPN